MSSQSRGVQVLSSGKQIGLNYLHETPLVCTCRKWLPHVTKSVRYSGLTDSQDEASFLAFFVLKFRSASCTSKLHSAIALTQTCDAQ